jgi:hypothetical protein
VILEISLYQKIIIFFSKETIFFRLDSIGKLKTAKIEKRAGGHLQYLNGHTYIGMVISEISLYQKNYNFFSKETIFSDEIALVSLKLQK